MRRALILLAILLITLVCNIRPAQAQALADRTMISIPRALPVYQTLGDLWLDLQLLAATAIHVVGVPYSLIGKFLRLPSSETIERTYQSLTVQHSTPCQADSAVTNPVAPAVDVEMATCA